jgi:hypothetical protein
LKTILRHWSTKAPVPLFVLGKTLLAMADISFLKIKLRQKKKKFTGYFTERGYPKKKSYLLRPVLSLADKPLFPLSKVKRGFF